MEISTKKLADNMQRARLMAGENRTLIAVVKCDSYGFGAVDCSKIFIENGADMLAVATLNEGLELRRGGITDTPIVVLGYTPPEVYNVAIENNIQLTLFNIDDIETFVSSNANIPLPLNAHIKLNTGMNRIGLDATSKSTIDSTVNIINKIAALPQINVSGVFSHFYGDYSQSTQQYNCFCECVSALNFTPQFVHISASSTLDKFITPIINTARVGISLYRGAMTLKTRVVDIRILPIGAGVSYNHTYITDDVRKIATLGVGYGDGYPRILSNKAKVRVNGGFADVIGNICMDMCMIDATSVNNINIGDEVVLMGGKIDVEDIANLAETIDYEIFTSINKRVPRVYTQD
ncbi:MAG: alanine racemase [Clostridiales bacterium]|jgi:alanine racemase|nr:alanine racemase [Clostridiales bacterium]